MSETYGVRRESLLSSSGSCFSDDDDDVSMDLPTAQQQEKQQEKEQQGQQKQPQKETVAVDSSHSSHVVQAVEEMREVEIACAAQQVPRYNFWLNLWLAFGSSAIVMIGLMLSQFLPLMLTQARDSDDKIPAQLIREQGEATAAETSETPASHSTTSSIRGFGINNAMAFFILSWDQLIGIFWCPWIGDKSDRIWVQALRGRRRPFVIFCLPLACVVNVLTANARSVYELCVYVVLFAFLMSCVRPVYSAYLGDLFPPEHRSRANGVNLFGNGIAGGISLLTMGVILEKFGLLVVMLVMSTAALLLMAVPMVMIRESKTLPHPVEDSDIARAVKQGIIHNFKVLWKSENRSCWYVLTAVFFIDIASASLQAGIISFAVKTIGIPPGQSLYYIALFAGTYTLLALPAGSVKDRTKRFRLINISMIAIMAISPTAYFAVTNKWTLAIALTLVGGFSACITVNLQPLIYDEGSETVDIGALTGLYYFTLSAGSIIGKLLTGVLSELTGGFRVIFLAGGLSIACACIFINIGARMRANVALRHHQLKEQTGDIAPTPEHRPSMDHHDIYDEVKPHHGAGAAAAADADAIAAADDDAGATTTEPIAVAGIGLGPSPSITSLSSPVSIPIPTATTTTAGGSSLASASGASEYTPPGWLTRLSGNSKSRSPSGFASKEIEMPVIPSLAANASPGSRNPTTAAAAAAAAAAAPVSPATPTGFTLSIVPDNSNSSPSSKNKKKSKKASSRQSAGSMTERRRDALSELLTEFDEYPGERSAGSKTHDGNHHSSNNNNNDAMSWYSAYNDDTASVASTTTTSKYMTQTSDASWSVPYVNLKTPTKPQASPITGTASSTTPKFAPHSSPKSSGKQPAAAKQAISGSRRVSDADPEDADESMQLHSFSERESYGRESSLLNADASTSFL